MINLFSLLLHLQNADHSTQMRHKCIAQIYDAFATEANDVILIMEMVQGVAMQKANAPGYNRPGVYVIDDWR